ncbi:hypothetical protein PHSY_003791 [Pseudozyma hubeiensis SY62]|uniref:Uncharacterized protein n=1 Tax=Pseudozyma hubeiensis (strain SY62) TaxID=1305764 RepID=R9P4C8_PSEHS|nr:hypothetical protein PHSY_003791 [Pseudozyma hubeiensis SY62]GAC96211.1 hypothetical protein PHSY_003791 [Pseudozyma hubeiensis SY62]
MMERHYPPEPAYSRAKAPSGTKGPSRSSASTILESAKRAYNVNSASSLAFDANDGPLLGNRLTPDTYSRNTFAFPSPTSEGPPVQPSLFAYGSSSYAGRTPETRKLKDSDASIYTARTKLSTRTKSTERLTIRNARGEIEWKDAPESLPALPSSSRHHHLPVPSASSPRRTPSPYNEVPLRSRARSNGALNRAYDDHRRGDTPQQPEIPFRAIGSTSPLKATSTQRPRNRRRSTDDADGYHTADEDDLEAREWERNRERQMAIDRHEVYQRQQTREEEERRARRRAERDRLAVEERERQREAEAKKHAEREARRLAREQAEIEEAQRKKLQREEAQRRRIEAEKAAAEERARKEKEAEERRARKKQLAEERRKREEQEAEELRIREEQEAEEQRKRDQEEAIRKAEEKAKRKEAKRLAAIERRKREEEEAIRKAEDEAKRREEERLAAIEAERLAKEAAIRAAREAVIEKARQLEEAKRQVEEEDLAAILAGRKADRLAQRALSAGLPSGELDSDSQQINGDDDASDAASEVFVDAGTEDDIDIEAKSNTADSMARSTSNHETPSSTDGSSDMPTTPRDENALPFSPPNPSTSDLGRQPSSNMGHGQVKFAPGTNGQATPMPVSPQQKMAPYKSDRFRDAVTIGARPTIASASISSAKSTVVPSTSLLTATFAATEEEDDYNDSEYPKVRPNGPYREGGITYGKGWCAHGLADPSLTIDHRRYVRAPRVSADAEAEEADAGSTDFDEVMYSDLGELIWSATTPDVIACLISHLDYADVKALRQTSSSIRFALGQLAGREIVLARFLSCVGYEAWTPTEVEGTTVDKDPFPLTFRDCEGFLLSSNLLAEYALVGAEWTRAPHKMDPNYPRLARASTRAYNRVLVRLRMQPNFRVPVPAKQHDGATAETIIASPWKPGRAGFFRAWVPSAEAGGWLSDTELARCERELLISGVLSHLKKGDVVWDCAVGDERNEGKYVFDGRYLRDLSFMFDRGGHLPSWINAFCFAPSYYHNIIRSSDASQPVIYLDVLPWRDQIVSTMRLVQDHVETFSPQGARYRIAKWLYRAVIDVVPGAIISDEGLEVVNAGWHGKIVIETEGTAEHAKELITRCAGPAESAKIKARLLASVMNADAEPQVPKAPAPTVDEKGNRVETTTPWAIVRARSRPGLIWIRPMDMRERVVF